MSPLVTSHHRVVLLWAGCTPHQEINFLFRRRSGQITQWRFSLLLLFFSLGRGDLPKQEVYDRQPFSELCTRADLILSSSSKPQEMESYPLFQCDVEGVFYEYVSPSLLQKNRCSGMTLCFLRSGCAFLCTCQFSHSIYFVILCTIFRCMPVLSSDGGERDCMDLYDLRVSLIYCLIPCIWF